MIKKLSSLLIVALFVLAMPSFTSANGPYSAKMNEQGVWTLQFDEAVKSNVINRSFIFIGDAQGKKLAGYTFSRVTVQGSTVQVLAPIEGYKQGETYTLNITQRFSKATGESFNVAVSTPFTVGEKQEQPEQPEVPVEKPTVPTPAPSEKPELSTDAYIATLNNNVWTVTFNEAVRSTVINRSHIYIGDADGQKLTDYKYHAVSVSGNTVTLAAPPNGYTQGETYTLVTTNRFLAASGAALTNGSVQPFTLGSVTPQEPTPQPEPETPTPEEPTPQEPTPEPPAVTPPTSGVKKYQVVNIANTGVLRTHSAYATFNEAKQRVGNNQGVAINGKLIAMKRGFIQTKAANGNVLTRVYSDANLTKERTYLPTNVEIAYVDATERSIRVNVAGQEGYISHDNAIFKPFNAYFTRNYYANVNGDLAHYIYSPLKNGYDSYTISAAPAFMIRGIKYYSVDGATFTDQAGTVIGTSYPYYQVASVRSKTKFTAAQIDAYIHKILQTRGSSAVQKSKIKGLGTTLVRLQNKYNINALAILSMAQHESAYGMSNHALQHNNLFGLNVTDNGNPADTYPSIANNIETLIIQYLEKKYLPPTSWFPNGSVFGNKDFGMNVKYASDPYWGSKIAGHYHRMMEMMQTLGYGQDQRYPVARFKESTVTTYKFSGMTQPAFTYNGNAQGKFVLILEETSSYYKISSDVNTFEYVYVPKHTLEKVATH